MFGRKKSTGKANKNLNVEAGRETSSSKKSGSSSKQESKADCCGKKRGSTKACK